MSTKDIAERYYTLFKAQQLEVIIQELYSPDIVSIEPENDLGLPRLTEGIEAYGKKQEAFFFQIEQVFGGSIEKPLVSKGFFTVRTTSDVKWKGKERMRRDEISVFKIKDGKISKEHFYYKN